MFSFSTGLTDLHIIHGYAIGKASLNILRNQLYHLEMVKKLEKDNVVCIFNGRM